MLLDYKELVENLQDVLDNCDVKDKETSLWEDLDYTLQRFFNQEED